MSYANLDKRWSVDDFTHYLSTVTRPKWVKGVTLHHSASPNLAQRPSGLSPQHMRNIASFYRNELGWSAGPHLFIDDTNTGILGMTPLTVKGVHARSFNSTHIGIEVLGDYDYEDPKTGRGLACWKNAAMATRLLLEWAGLPDTAVNFHRNDPKTKKTCAGKKVTLEWFLSLLKEGIERPHSDFVKLSDHVSGITKTASGFVANGVRFETAFYDKDQECTLVSRGELARLGLL
jgi:hypothetical protein